MAFAFCIRITGNSNSRIVFYDESKVTIVCEDEEKKWYISLIVEEFIGNLVQHIPKKGFKIIRSFGIFSRRMYKVEFKTEKIIEEKQEIIIKYFDHNCGVRCRLCGRIMELLGFYSPKLNDKPPPKERIQRRIGDWIS